MTNPKGWLKAVPLEKYSSLNELSLGQLIGLPLLDKRFFLQFSFNLHTPLTIDPRAYLTFEMRDASRSPSYEKCCYSIKDFNRWRLDIQGYKTLADFLKDCKSAQRNKFKKSKKVFFQYGCTTEYIEKDWSHYASQVYKLYSNVAERHGNWLYDLTFFEECAKREDYSLLIVWHEGEMIAMGVLQKEHTTLHSICGGFDYVHSSPCYAYSWLNYLFIELAIVSGRYKEIDVGITANIAKKNIGYKPVPSRLDVYSKSLITRGILSAISPFIHTTFDTNGKLELV
jgi:predicted N-acyltransferase